MKNSLNNLKNTMENYKASEDRKKRDVSQAAALEVAEKVKAAVEKMKLGGLRKKRAAVDVKKVRTL